MKINEHEKDHVEQKLREFPTHNLSHSSQESMHQNVIRTLKNNEKNERRGTIMKKMIAGIATVAAITLLMFLVMPTFLDDDENTGDNTTSENEQQEEQDNQDNQEEQNDEQQNEDDQNKQFTKETAQNVMQNYKQNFTTLIDSAEQDGLLPSFESQSEVHDHFTEVMSDDLASWMVESYINEEDDGVYLIAKDGPTWLAEDTDFSIEEVTDEHYKIIQERNSEMLGHREMIYHAKWQEDKWIVDSIDSKKLEEQVSIEQKSQEIIRGLHDRQMEYVANYVHEQKGLLFSPYVHVEEDAVTFEQDEVASLLDDKTTYLWGNYDGSGDPIELTPSGYFEEFLNVEPFLSPDEVLVDEYKQRGNTTNNIEEEFPEATVVEFYKSGSGENEEMNWSSINLVFEQNENGIWKLVALVSDQWTI
ncbi:hypothetical protein GCM10011351_27430 [Paraliobacillus quinghaiensis]|uniref:Uncharacterized protein n=1 Tax=Paraliobacillus quinghaiensis TaxID=470815 RepID=A0A917TX23_9BACI|nr:hypothetical protein [Paraliobacillus quinghaiensis]GGM39801.1 hypothetical protein GCM10011351_27430 [Paraliobacillus quinghaiensis]